MLSDDMIIALISCIGGVITSSGLWAFIQKRTMSHDAQTRLIKGLAYDKILTRGIAFLERGWVTRDEYEEYLNYLVKPYKEMGGNGVAEKVANEVASLPFRTMQFSEIVVKGQIDETH